MFTNWCNVHYRDKKAASLAVHSKIKFAPEAEHKMVYNTILPKMRSIFEVLFYQFITLTLYFLLFTVIESNLLQSIKSSNYWLKHHPTFSKSHNFNVQSEP